MTDDRFTFLCMFAQRIESEVYRYSADLFQLRDRDFETRPEGDLARASKQLRETADYIDKKLQEIAAHKGKAA